MTDKYGIIANVISDNILRTNAKVWIVYCNGDGENPRVIGLNKGGRWTEKYIPYKRLRNFRANWIPKHLREQVIWQYDTRNDAVLHALALTQMWSDVRAFNRDGSCMIKDGISAGDAHKRYREQHRHTVEIPARNQGKTLFERLWRSLWRRDHG